MDKDFWVLKSGGHVSEESTAKRSHNWFVDTGEPEMFPNKRQALQAQGEKTSVNVSPWENPSGFHSVSSQFIDRLFGSESQRLVDIGERSMSPARTESMEQKVIEENFRGSSSVELSMSHHVIEDPGSCFMFGGSGKLKPHHAKDISSLHASKEECFNGEKDGQTSGVQSCDRENENSFLVTAQQEYGKDYSNVTLMSHSYYSKNNDPVPLGDTYNKENSSLISFSGMHGEHDIISMPQTIRSCDLPYDRPPVQTSDMAFGKQFDALNVASSPGARSIAKAKPESKSSRKEAPNSFPSNVRSLISTGMLDGVPVKYISPSHTELRGVISGSGYLCACQSCNHSKVLNAYEFERHAGCKTKHPNNHIYFENGKTIYQIVQELRSTPESMLFDVIQTVFGAPINQKAFRSWKESFQAATRELQRIYGKEELNL